VLPLYGFSSSSKTTQADEQLLPSLLPSRMTRSLRRAPFVLALLLPIVTFIIIGRTVEIERDRIPAYVPDMGSHEGSAEIVKRAFSATKKLGLSGTSSAGAGISEFLMHLPSQS